MISEPDNECAVVLDACVLVPMPLCDTLLRLGEEPKPLYRPLWSEEILCEVRRALAGKLNRSPQQCERRIQAMRTAFPEAVVTFPSDFVKALECVPDPNDRHVLATAIHGRADAIITQNTKHFPAECLQQYAIRCQNPDDFLMRQFYLSPAQVLEKLELQAAAIHENSAYIVKSLKKMAPQFAELIVSAQ